MDKSLMASKWLCAAQRQLTTGRIADADQDAIVGLLELCRDDPRSALDIIYEIVSSTSETEILEYLGAGPLEDILASNCDLFIDELIDISRSNLKLRTCMKAVEIYEEECSKADHFYAAINE